jgi:hypothetical protein
MAKFETGKTYAAQLFAGVQNERLNGVSKALLIAFNEVRPGVLGVFHIKNSQQC